MSAPVYADGAINDSAAWAEIIHLRAERDAALARITTLEASLQPFAEWHRDLLPPQRGPIYAACADAAAALAGAPGDDKAHEADPTQGPDK